MQEYSRYLESEHWQQIRKLAIAAAEYRCQVCNGAKSLHVHHRTYERLGRERRADLVVLCAECHALFHGSGGRVKNSARSQSRPEIGRAYKEKQVRRKKRVRPRGRVFS